MSVYKPKGSKTFRYAYSEYQPDGTRKRRVRVAPTKAIAKAREAKQREIQQEVRQGLKTPKQANHLWQSGRMLMEHAADYLADLRAAGRSTGHVASTGHRLGKLIVLAPFTFPHEITPEGLNRALEKYKATAQESNGRKPGQHSANKAGAALKAMLNWMVDNGRLASNPIARAKLPRVTEVLHPRRAADAETAEKLVKAAREMPPRGKWTRDDREMLVRLALGTGLRASELRSLTRASFRIVTDQPAVTVEAAYSKNRKPVTQPISESLASHLLLWLDKKPGRGPVFPFGKNYHLAETMQRICKKAGVPYRNEEGFLDGHSLRHTFITNVGRRTDIKTAMELARHGSVAMTARYMHTTDELKRKAVEGK